MASGGHDAVVVGAGPNGLAAGIVLARAGLRVLMLEAEGEPGGAARSAELTLPGFIHDMGSAIHPMAAGSPFFRSLNLEQWNLKWVHPGVPVAHPLDGAAAGVLERSLEATAAGLGADGAAYLGLMGPLVRQWAELADEVLQPLPHVPRHPVALGRFGLRALVPAQWTVQNRFRTEAGRALFAGLAAHSFLPFGAVASSAIPLVLGMMGHGVGWPFPEGGAGALARALAGCFKAAGGELECRARVGSLGELPKARAILLDVSPRQFLEMAGERVPAGYRRRLERFRPGPGVFKVDYALGGPVPWRAGRSRSARSCWRRSRRCLTRRERRRGSTHSGRIAMCHWARAWR